MANEYLNATPQGGGWAAIRKLTVASGVVTGAGAWLIFAFVENHSSTSGASAEAAASDSKIEGNNSNGVKIQYPQVTKTLDGLTGAEVSGGSAGGNKSKISFTTFETKPSNFALLMDMQSGTVEVCIPHGYSPSGETGGDYQVGNITNDLTIQGQANTLQSVQVEVTGSSIVTDAGGDTALAEGPGEVTPLGGVAVTPDVPDDIAELKAGKLHLVVG